MNVKYILHVQILAYSTAFKDMLLHDDKNTFDMWELVMKIKSYTHIKK